MEKEYAIPITAQEDYDDERHAQLLVCQEDCVLPLFLIYVEDAEFERKWK